MEYKTTKTCCTSAKAEFIHCLMLFIIFIMCVSCFQTVLGNEQQTIDLVIATCGEDVTWASFFGRLPGRKTYIFDDSRTESKDLDGILYGNRTFHVPTREKPSGAEGAAYLRFIVDHYDTIADWTVFSQANPFVHSPDFITLITNPAAWKGPIQPLTYRAHARWGPLALLTEEWNSTFLLNGAARVYIDPADEALGPTRWHNDWVYGTVRTRFVGAPHPHLLEYQ